jgi:hypothetical protein
MLLSRVQAILFTMTTYGTWLRGDARGWVDQGVVFPPDPVLEIADRERMARPLYRFPEDAWFQVGQWIGMSLKDRLHARLLAMTVQAWHVHIVSWADELVVADFVKCAKDAVRWGLRLKRPIWGEGYDKRYCYEAAVVRARIDYVERHNVARERPRKPWDFIETWDA